MHFYQLHSMFMSSHTLIKTVIGFRPHGHCMPREALFMYFHLRLSSSKSTPAVQLYKFYVFSSMVTLLQ